MNKREFGHKENNYTPIGGYNTAKHSPQGRGYNAYETPEQQSARWIRQERAAYDEAYPEEASFLRAQTVVKEREYVPSGSFDLPVWAKASEIAYAITHDPVTFVVGETGSGKSTQLPQIALNAGVKYVQQLQPLRLAARTIGERVGEEILSARPYESPEIVGIHTGEVNTSTARTKFLSATEGIVYAQDVHNRPMQEGELRIHDEIHKAGIIGDMAIAMSVDRMRKNPDMRIVLQSATFDVERWVNYFEKELGVTPTIIEVEGRTYPVEVIEKPEVESPEQAIECIKEHYAIHQQQKKMVADGYEGELTLTSGAVACPGLGEIKMWTEEIIKGLPAEMVNGIKFVPLHSRQTRKDQERALRTDYDELKVIMGTDAMRSSVTVEDLGWLVDCGYARHLELDKEGVESLVLYPTSHADRMQWMGRIGRMGPGKGYQTKMSVAGPYIPLDEAHRFDEPEIKRSNIEEFILGVKAVGINFEDLPLPARADVAVVERCRENLRKVGALDDAYELTAIGRRMVDCSTGYISARMLVEADKYSPDVRAYMAAIAASQEAGGLQSFRMNGSKRWKGEDGLTTENTSDLFAQLDLFIAAQHLPPYEWRQYDLDEKSIKQAREYYYKMIRKSKATFGKLEAPNAEQREELLNCIYAGMVDNVFAYIGTSNKKRTYTGLSRFKSTPRTLSSRSVVDSNSPYVLGTPRGVQSVKKDVLKKIDIVQGVTAVDDLRKIGQLAGQLCDWELEKGKTTWRDGRPTIVRKQTFHGISTGNTQELVATPSPETRAAIIQHALANPGPEQQKIRDIKKQLEELQHYAKDDVRQLTQTILVEMVKKAAPQDILDAYMIDHNLQQMNITLETFGMTLDAMQEIMDNAPDSIVTDVGELRLQYRNSRPVVNKFDRDTISVLSGDVRLPDGREVYFIYSGEDSRKKREYTLAQLKSLLSVSV